MGKLVLVLIEMSIEQQEHMRSIAPENQIIFFNAGIKPSKQELQSANVIIGNPGAANIACCKNLEFLQCDSAGVEQYLLPGILPENVVLGNATGAFGDGIAEYMVAVTHLLFRNLHLYRDLQKKHEWKKLDAGKRIYGSTVAVLGPGDIGGSYAKRMKNLGCTVIGIRRTNCERPVYLDEQYTIEELDAVLPRADVVAMAMPSTPQTRNLLNRERIARLKPDSILINVGRGDVLDEQALMHALQEGKLRGAALDVFAKEPLPKDSPLWEIENLIITPHNNGGGSPQQTMDQVPRICIQGYEDYALGRKISTKVNPETGYRE